MVTPKKPAPATKTAPTTKAPARLKASTPPAKRRIASVPKPGVTATLEAFLSTLELDEANATRGAVAIVLANKLDQARSDHTGAVAMAVAGLARELSDVLDAILEGTAADDEFVRGLFSED